MYKKSIFWFRQDLRTYDNVWLYNAVKNSEKLLVIFILDKNIINDFLWLNDKKFWFIREALERLDSEIKSLWWEWLKVFYDKPETLIPELTKKYNINAVFTNRSYWNYWKKRDESIKNTLSKSNIEFLSYKDYLLVEPWEIEQRKVFTPFYKLWQKIDFDTNEYKITDKIDSIKIEENNKAKDYISIEKHPYFTMDFWEKRLEKYITTDYDLYRNDLDKDWTSKLSPYLRFWIFSVRQIYNLAKNINQHFVSEMAWREFWQHIDYYFPETKKIEFQENKRHIKWRHDEYLFEKWCNWETWYPVVDAAMKQLVETNWMHWRARMIVSSFLTKDLLIDWRWWEKFFKKHLLDYDENVNYWNWQWWASVWADPKPLRIFNPILQSQKFDSQAKFIKKYIPELINQNTKAIHDPIDNELDYTRIIVNHKEAQRETRLVYKWEKD